MYVFTQRLHCLSASAACWLSVRSVKHVCCWKQPNAPELVAQLVVLVPIVDPGDVVGQRVEPHIHDVGGVIGKVDAPLYVCGDTCRRRRARKQGAHRYEGTHTYKQTNPGGPNGSKPPGPESNYARHTCTTEQLADHTSRMARATQQATCNAGGSDDSMKNQQPRPPSVGVHSCVRMRPRVKTTTRVSLSSNPRLDPTCTHSLTHYTHPFTSSSKVVVLSIYLPTWSDVLGREADKSSSGSSRRLKIRFRWDSGWVSNST